MSRILVVDDSPTILKVVSAILARNGFEPEVAKDGALGLKAIAEQGPFDLVLLDFVMPKMNGYQFCRELRSNPKYKAVPVLLMSAKGDRIREQFVQQTGAIDAITKPFDARGLVAAVEGALAKMKAGRAPIVPEGETMPEESSLTEEESRPSVLPRRLEKKALADLVRHVSAIVTPALLELSDADKKSAEAIDRVIGRTLSHAPLDGLVVSLREASSATSKEVLSGDLALMPLAEVMQLLEVQRQTGVMRVLSGGRGLSIHLREGLIDLVRAASDKTEFRLGRYFVEMGLVTRPEIEAAAEAAAKAERRIGDELVVSGRVTEAQRHEALVKQASELVYDLVRWQYGRFWFSRDPVGAEAEAAKLGLGVAGLVLEGFRRVDEWRLMEGTIVWDQVVVVDDGARERVGSSLTRAESMVLDAVDGKRTITQVLAQSELGRYDAVKIVYQFLSSRVLRART
ncbi:MAG TPA: response regulator [Polyangiaceae bacterium]|nr:response regulator [Polyangiaceae bacterium]